MRKAKLDLGLAFFLIKNSRATNKDSRKPFLCQWSTKPTYSKANVKIGQEYSIHLLPHHALSRFSETKNT